MILDAMYVLVMFRLHQSGDVFPLHFPQDTDFIFSDVTASRYKEYKVVKVQPWHFRAPWWGGWKLG